MPAPSAPEASSNVQLVPVITQPQAAAPPLGTVAVPNPRDMAQLWLQAFASKLRSSPRMPATDSMLVTERVRLQHQQHQQ